MHSMTAFARCARHSQWGAMSWELRSVNQRFLDITLRLPEELRDVETATRQRVNARLNRGKVDCILRLQHAPGGVAINLNRDFARQLIQAGEEIDRLLMRQSSPMNPLDILRWPGVMQTPEPQIEALQAEAMTLLDEALDALAAQRAREGADIREVMVPRCTALQQQVAEVRRRLPAVKEKLRARLAERLAQLRVEVDAGRFEQEMVYWLQKVDVEEELDRADAHLQEVQNLLQRDEPVGRRLDFLMQELNREANTLAAKSADIDTTRASVEMKVLIEQMREQVQNIE
jgi:uncharacterized protein (TIGR00255 family)